MADIKGTVNTFNTNMTKILDLLGEIETVLTMESEVYSCIESEIMSESISVIWDELNQMKEDFNKGL